MNTHKKYLSHIISAVVIIQASTFTPSSQAAEIERIEVRGYWLPQEFYIDLYFAGNYQPQVLDVYNSPLSGGNNNANPYALTQEEEEEFFENAYDKTPWTTEQKSYFLAELDTFIKAYEKLIENTNLTDDMTSKLTSALGKAVTLYGAISGYNIVSNYLLNEEYAESVAAIAEITIGAAAVALGATAVIVVGGVPGVGLGALISVAGVVAGKDAKAYLSGQLHGLSFSNWVRDVANRMESVAWEANSFDFVNYVCSHYPSFKWELIDGCENAVGVPPIFVDLDGDGFQFLTAEYSNVKFDVNFDGKRNALPWAIPSDPVLFIDLNQSGVMDDTREFMFANYSLLKNATDLDGLKMFDINSDGYLDRNDPSYDHFYLWSDKNSDGISTQDEVVSLSQQDIYFELSARKTDDNFGVARKEEEFTVHFYFDDEKTRDAGSFEIFTIN